MKKDDITSISKAVSKMQVITDRSEGNSPDDYVSLQSSPVLVKKTVHMTMFLSSHYQI
jgi:hypothetical protein